MAVVSIKGDTRDAQRKIKALRQDIDNLDKAAKKPKKVNMQTKGISTGSIAASAGMIGSKTMGMAVAGGSFIGSVAASAFSKLVEVLSTAIPAVLKFGLGIDNVTGLMNKWSKALDAYSNAPAEAMKRADSMDALDDERRAHNNRSLAEEYAWTEAFTNVGGSEFQNRILTRIQALIDGALGGDISSLSTLQQLDRKVGEVAVGPRGEMADEYAIGSHLQEMSTHEILAEILKNYHSAREQGDYSAVGAMEELVGRRGLGIINKLTDVGDIERQKALYEQKWNETYGNEGDIMKAAAQSEEIRSLGKIYQYGVPDGGEKYITQGAQNEADANRLSFEALGADGAAIVEKAKEEFAKDFNEVSEQVKNSPVGQAIKEHVVEPLKQYSDKIEQVVDGVDRTIEKVEETIDAVGKLTEGIETLPKSVWEYIKPGGGLDQKYLPKVLLENGGIAGAGVDLQMKVASAMLSPFLKKDPSHQIKPEIPEPSEGQIRAFGDNAYKPLVENDPLYPVVKEFEEGILNGLQGLEREKAEEVLDPDTFNKRFYEEYVKPQQQPAEQQKQPTEGEKAMTTALNEMTNNIKQNISAQQALNTTMRNGLTIKGNTSSQSVATFA